MSSHELNTKSIALRRGALIGLLRGDSSENSPQLEPDAVRYRWSWGVLRMEEEWAGPWADVPDAVYYRNPSYGRVGMILPSFASEARTPREEWSMPPW